MVLAYLGIATNYERLTRQLGIENSSIPFSTIDQLRSWWLAVDRKQGNIEILQAHLAARQPVITPVDTAILPYWITRLDIDDDERATDHAVVIVGMDDRLVYVNDPDFIEAPQAIEYDWFHDAWRHHARWYAVIRRRLPWRLRRV
jgi:hypothetical protein